VDTYKLQGPLASLAACRVDDMECRRWHSRLCPSRWKHCRVSAMSNMRHFGTGACWLRRHNGPSKLEFNGFRYTLYAISGVTFWNHLGTEQTRGQWRHEMKTSGMWGYRSDKERLKREAHSLGGVWCVAPWERFEAALGLTKGRCRIASQDRIR
jgi:hypothetical protein